MSVCALTNRTTSWRDTWTFTARHKKTIDGCVVVIKTQNDVITDQTGHSVKRHSQCLWDLCAVVFE